MIDMVEGPSVGIKSILCVSTGGLGDVILFSPVFKALGTCYPEAEIELLVASRLAERAFSPAKELNRVTYVNTNQHLVFLRMFPLLVFGLKSRLRVSGYDFGVFATGLNPYLEKVTKIFSDIKSVIRAPIPPQLPNDLTCNIHLARNFDSGISEKDVFLPRIAEARSEAYGVTERYNISMGKDRIIAFYPSKELPHRPRWDPKNFIEIVHRFKKDGFTGKFIVVGSLQEGEEWKKIDKDNSVDANLAGKLSILASAELLSRCCITVGNDGGLMHAAGAVECPLVVIMTNTPPTYRPPGEKTVVIQSKLTCCADSYPKRPDWCRVAGCAADISADGVYDVCRNVIANSAEVIYK